MKFIKLLLGAALLVGGWSLFWFLVGVTAGIVSIGFEIVRGLA